jgi:hypothetical protein
VSVPAPRWDTPGWAEFLRSQGQGFPALDFFAADLLRAQRYASFSSTNTAGGLGFRHPQAIQPQAGIGHRDRRPTKLFPPNSPIYLRGGKSRHL